MARTCFIAVLAAFTHALVLSAAVHAANAPASYPSRPVRMIVPSGAGGGTDIIGRIVAQKLTETWGQSVVVDNRPGASSVIGVELAARAAPDGYTLVMVSAGFAINPSLMRSIPYDPVRDFAAVIHVASTANVLVAHPSLGLATVNDFVGLARAKPGQIAYASAGTGSAPHLAMELLRGLTSINLVHVPYKGSGPATLDVLGGRVPVMFSTLPTAMPHLKSGKLRGLGVSTARRSSAAPDIASIAEAYPGYEAAQWYGLLAPAGTAPGVVRQIHDAVAAVLSSPDLTKLLSEQGADMVGGSSKDFGVFIAREKDRWAAVAARAGIRPQ